MNQWLRIHLPMQGTPVQSLVKVKVTQSCPALCDPMDYTVHGILQARILEWVAISFSRGPGVGDGQGGLVCCNSWGHKESDTTE